MTESILVDQQGTKLAYTDSGPPSNAYTTIFAVHGLAFNAGIFERVQACAKRANVRFVAVTRRNYQGSTPFTEAELKVLNGGSAEEKNAFLAKRGVELLIFIDKFLADQQIPLQAPEKGETGGVAIIGWSLGNTVALSAIANLSSIAPDAKARLAPLIHTLILHDPSKNILGHASDANNWAPMNVIDKTIPKKSEIPFFVWWVSSYFQHGDLSKRSHEELEYHAPGFNRPPTVYSLASADRLSVVESGAALKADVPYQVFLRPQFLASYNSLFSKELKDLLPNLKAFLISGEHSAAFSPSTAWMVQDHDKEHGGGFIKAKILRGFNHFSAWDEPESTLQAYQDCITRSF